MLKILDRYLFKLLSFRIWLISIILVIIIWLTKSVQLFQKISDGLPASILLQLTILALPPFLTEVLPFALFTTIILTWSSLIMDREIVVMQATGLSHLRLARAPFILSFLIFILSLILNLWLVPSSYLQLRSMQHQAREHVHLVLKEGAITEINSNQHIYIEDREDNILTNISLYVNDPKSQTTQTITAKQGVISQDENGDLWILLLNGTRSFFDQKADQVNQLEFESYHFPYETEKQSVKPKPQNIRELPTMNLLESMDDPAISAEFHKRFSTPFLSLAYAFIALVFMRSGNLLRRQHGRHILMAALTVFALRASIFMISVISTNFPIFIFFNYVLIFIAIGLGYYYLTRKSF